MSIIELLQSLGYSDHFIEAIENSFVDHFDHDFYRWEEESSVKSYDSASFFLEESATPVLYNSFSDTAT